MKKFSRLPHEQVTTDGDGGFGAEHDGLPVDGGDVEGHGAKSPEPTDFLPGLPGTGGDDLRQIIGEDDDVEGHIMGHTKGERLAPGMPGTGGDQIAVNVEDADDRT
jgi:hypothetical protein